MGEERKTSSGGPRDTQPQSNPPHGSEPLSDPSVRVFSSGPVPPHDTVSRASGRSTQVTAVALASTNAQLTASVEVDEALGPGERVDHFQIMRLLGRGGMGEVYVARDTKLGRKVALKVIHPKYLGSPAAIRGFLEEARTTAKFSHPHIVMIHGVGEHRGRPYVALEYLEGVNLRARMLEQPLSLQATLRIALAVAEALEEAHRGGVLHLDLKPENVMIPEDGRVRVVDFGLARPATMMESGEVRASDEVTGVWGTPAYMAPEQWQRKKPSAATDVWGLGMMLFELCSDWLPFDLEGSKSRLMAKVTDPEPVPRIEKYAHVPVEVADFIASCLRKDPRKRPKVAEVADALRELLFGDATRPADDEGPFRGLLPFTERHAAFFFGREAEVAAFVERTRLSPVLPVVGPSGAGKSSFVRAGVLPRLREEGSWIFITMRPGAHPFEALAARLVRAERAGPTEKDAGTVPPPAKRSDPTLRGLADEPTSAPGLDAAEAHKLAEQLEAAPQRLALELLRLASMHDARVLLFVDQVEELFTLNDDPSQRAAFMEAICAADDPADPVRVVFTVRDDFLGRLALGDTVARALTQVTVIQRLKHRALEDTLLRPVDALGYRFEDDDLAIEMVASVEDAPGALPMLQFAARQLWERRDNVRRLLMRADYLEMGGVEGALATHADGVLDAMSAAELRAAREIMLRMVTDDATRARLSKSECLAGLRKEAVTVLGRLMQARLLVTTKRQRDADAEVMLELAHDSLITSWGTLQRWLDESREELVFAREAGQAAALWDKRGQNPQELWRGVALADALRMLDRITTEIPAKTASFLAAGKERELSRGRRRRGLYGGILLLSAVVAAGFAVFAWVVRQKGHEATAQRDLAERRRAATLRESARAAMTQGNVLEARAKLRLALDVEDDPSARALWWQLSETPVVWRHKLGDRVFGVAFTPGAKTIAAGCADGAVYVFDAQTRQRRVLHGNGDQVLGLAASPLGDTLATISTGGPVRIWDLSTGRPRPPLLGHTQRPTSIRYSADGKRIVTSSNDGSVRVWSASDGESLAVFELGEPVGAADVHPLGDGYVAAVGVSLAFISSDGRITRVEVGHTEPLRAVRFTADGSHVATGGADGKVTSWDVSAGRGTSFDGHGGSVWALALRGDRLVTGGDDGKLRVWSRSKKALVTELAAHEKQITGVAISEDGKRVATSSFDGQLRVWDVGVAGEMPAEIEPREGVRGLAFSPDGTTLASGSYDGAVRLWDVATGAQTAVMTGHSGRIYEVVFSPDGRSVATTSADWSARLWDVDTTRQTRVLVGHGGPVVGVAFHPKGKWLATGSKDRTMRLWNLGSGSQSLLARSDEEIGGVVFSPDGSVLVAGGKTLIVWDTETRKIVKRLEGHEDTALGLSYAAGQLISGSLDGTVRRWDLDAGSSTLVGRHPQRVYWVHQHGGRVSASSSDGVGRIWPAEGPAIELRGHADEVNNAVFDPGGELVATSSDDGTVRVWRAKDGRPFWRAPALLTTPIRLYSHRGWERVVPTGESTDDAPEPQGGAYRAAIEKRAKWAEQAGSVLCLLTHDDGAELWSLDRDAKLSEAQGPFSKVAAHARGCLLHGGRGAEFLGANMAPTRLETDGDAAAIGVGDGLAVATTTQAFVFGLDAAEEGVVPIDAGVSALAVVTTEVAGTPARALVAGFRDGHLSLEPLDGARSDVAFQDVISGAVSRIAPGPANTVAVGYDNGFVGLWSLRDGARLAGAQLHGRVVHLRVHGQRLVASTDLGASVSWNLDAFYEPYCGLVRRVWAHVPVVWDGRPVLRPAPTGHTCSQP